MNTSAEEDISFQGVWICSSVWSIHLPCSYIQAVAYEMQCISGVHSTAWCQRPSCISHPRSAIILEEIHCLVGSSCYCEKEIIWGKRSDLWFIGISDKVMASLMDNQKMGGIPSLQDWYFLVSRLVLQGHLHNRIYVFCIKMMLMLSHNYISNTKLCKWKRLQNVR